MKASPGCGPAEMTFLHCDIRHQVNFKSPWGRNQALFCSFSEQLAKKQTFFFSLAHPIIKAFARHFPFLLCDFQSARFLLTSEHQRLH